MSQSKSCWPSRSLAVSWGPAFASPEFARAPMAAAHNVTVSALGKRYFRAACNACIFPPRISVGIEAFGADPELRRPAKVLSVGARHVVLPAGLGAQEIFAAGTRLDGIDERDIDQHRAVDADEPVGSELLGYSRDRLPQQIGARFLLQQYVVAVRLGADQLAGIDEHHAPLVLDRDPRRALGSQIEIGQHLEQPRGTLLSRAPHGHVQSLVYPFWVERLENIVHGALLERLDGVLRVGRDEDDRRHRPVLLAEPLDELQSREVGHVNVEQQNVVRVGAERRQGLVRILGDVEFLHVGPLRQQLRQSSPRERLIVDDQDAHHDSHVRAARAGSSESSSATVANAGSVRVMMARAPSCSSRKSREASSEYRYLRRALAFAMPTPRPGCERPPTVLRMRTCSRPSLTLASTSIQPPSSELAIPCTRAFS